MRKLTIIASLLLLATAAHAGRQVYLESERDLGNGMKLCIYSEGAAITIASHRLCPLNIHVE
jgi:hypothetical protein